MSNKPIDARRRLVMQGIAVAPLAAILVSQKAFAGLLDPNAGMAKTLAYTHTSAKPDQNCANCQLYQAGADGQGNCPLFGQDLVKATGWCSSWVAKS
jgi:hypothetical protein